MNHAVSSKCKALQYQWSNTTHVKLFPSDTLDPYVKKEMQGYTCIHEWLYVMSTEQWKAVNNC